MERDVIRDTSDEKQSGKIESTKSSEVVPLMSICLQYENKYTDMESSEDVEVQSQSRPFVNLSGKRKGYFFLEASKVVMIKKWVYNLSPIEVTKKCWELARFVYFSSIRDLNFALKYSAETAAELRSNRAHSCGICDEHYKKKIELRWHFECNHHKEIFLILEAINKLCSEWYRGNTNPGYVIASSILQTEAAGLHIYTGGTVTSTGKEVEVRDLATSNTEKANVKSSRKRNRNKEKQKALNSDSLTNASGTTEKSTTPFRILSDAFQDNHKKGNVIKEPESDVYTLMDFNCKLFSGLDEKNLPLDRFMMAAFERVMKVHWPLVQTEFYCRCCNYVYFSSQYLLDEHKKTCTHMINKRKFPEAWCVACQIHNGDTQGYLEHLRTPRHSILQKLFDATCRNSVKYWNYHHKPKEVENVSSNEQIWKILEKVFHCSICQMTRKNPKILHCKHSFCQQCLQKLVVVVDNISTMIECHVCKAIHQFIPNNDVRCLKAPVVMKQLLDVVKKKITPNGIQRAFEDGEPSCCGNTILWYDLVSKTFFCIQCVSPNKGNLLPVQYSKECKSIVPFCEQHKSTHTFGCLKCSTTMCSYCKMNNHVGHEAKYITEYTDIFKKPLHATIKAMKDCIVKESNAKEQLIASLCSSKEKDIENVKKRMVEKKMAVLSQTMLMFEAVEKQIMKKFMDSYTMFEKSANDAIEKLNTKLTGYQTLLEQAESVMEKSIMEVILNTREVIDNVFTILPIKVPTNENHLPEYKITLNQKRDVYKMSRTERKQQFDVTLQYFDDMEITLDQQSPVKVTDGLDYESVNLSHVNNFGKARQYVMDSLKNMGISGSDLTTSDDKKDIVKVDVDKDANNVSVEVVDTELPEIILPGNAKFSSYKDSLQMYCRKRNLGNPTYTHTKLGEKRFIGMVCFDSNCFSSNEEASSQKQAGMLAAYEALKQLGYLIDVPYKTLKNDKKDIVKHDDDKDGVNLSVKVLDNGKEDCVRVDDYKDGNNLSVEVLDTELPWIILPGNAKFSSYKDSLHHYCGKRNLGNPTYSHTNVGGKRFIGTVCFGSNCVSSKEGALSKKQADMYAAYEALKQLGYSIDVPSETSLKKLPEITLPGDSSFVSYSSSLEEYCEVKKVKAPSYKLTFNGAGFCCIISFQCYTIYPEQVTISAEEAMALAAFKGLKRLGYLEDQGFEFSAKGKHKELPEITLPGDSSFVSYSNSLQEYCEVKKVKAPSYKSTFNGDGFCCIISFACYTIFPEQIAYSAEEAMALAAFKGLQSLGYLEDEAFEFSEKVTSASQLESDLKVSDNVWLRLSERVKYPPGKEGTEHKLKRDVQRILKKVATQNIASSALKILQLQIKEMEELESLVELIFEKAVMEPLYSAEYAHICKFIIEKGNFIWQNILPYKKDGRYWWTFKFNALIIKKCREEFEKMVNEPWKNDDPLEKIKNEELGNATETIRQKRNFGNSRFIGELYKLTMISENVIYYCIERLLTTKDKYKCVDHLKCLCILLSTVGMCLDQPGEKKMNMNGYFLKIKLICDSQKLSPDVKTVVKDLIELRCRHWVVQDAHVHGVTLAVKESVKEKGNKMGKWKSKRKKPLKKPLKKDSMQPVAPTRAQPSPSSQGTDGWSTVPIKSNKKSTTSSVKEVNPSSVNAVANEAIQTANRYDIYSQCIDDGGGDDDDDEDNEERHTDTLRYSKFNIPETILREGGNMGAISTNYSPTSGESIKSFLKGTSSSVGKSTSRDASDDKTRNAIKSALQGYLNYTNKQNENLISNSGAIHVGEKEMEEIIRRTQNCEHHEELIKFIEENITLLEQNSPSFIDDLTKAVCRASICEDDVQGYVCNKETIEKNKYILVRYINGSIDLELQTLYSIQQVMVELIHPQGVLRELFDHLHTHVISEETFLLWKISEDYPAGKDDALKSLIGFFEFTELS